MKILHVGGTKLKPRQFKLALELNKHGMKPTLEVHDYLRRNPNTGATHFLPPLACVLFDWIVDRARGRNIEAGKESIALWHAARYLFRDLWPDELFRFARLKLYCKNCKNKSLDT